MSTIPPVGPERVAFAWALHERALALGDLVFPPWRWRRWRREYRAIRRDSDALRAALDATHEGSR